MRIVRRVDQNIFQTRMFIWVKSLFASCDDGLLRNVLRETYFIVSLRSHGSDVVPDGEFIKNQGSDNCVGHSGPWLYGGGEWKRDERRESCGWFAVPLGWASFWACSYNTDRTFDGRCIRNSRRARNREHSNREGALYSHGSKKKSSVKSIVLSIFNKKKSIVVLFVWQIWCWIFFNYLNKMIAFN